MSACLRLLTVVLVVVVATLVQKSEQQCTAYTTLQSDSTPANPGISASLLTSSSPYLGVGYSETVRVRTMGSATPPPWPRQNCPHLLPLGNGNGNGTGTGALTPFEVLFPTVTTGMNITIGAGMNVLFRSCSLGANPNSVVINRIDIVAGGSLVFDDNNGIVLNVREIFVDNNSSFAIGSPTCRLFGTVNITFYGARNSSTTMLFDPSKATSKGIESLGTVDMHGKQYHPTWTRLSRAAWAGSSVVFLQDPVNWEVGQSVVVLTSQWLDCPPETTAQFCNGAPSQNEVMTIAALSIVPSTGEQAVQFTAPLVYNHYADLNYQIEVALLSRRINMAGFDSGDQFGGHSINVGPAIGRFSGVRGDKMGQMNVLARYPFHFHHLTPQSGAQSFFQDCAVTNSFFRCYTIHATNNSRASRNVAFNAYGNCYYLEDGVEENNVLEYNLGAFIHPIGPPANGGWGQTASNVVADSVALVNPADTSASAFYILNAYNTFVGNAASGGWSGFSFPNVGVSGIPWNGASPPAGQGGSSAGVFTSSNITLGWNCPSCRPTLLFQSNTAHSTGFYWQEHGSAIYVGGWLWYDETNGNVLTYNSGRFSRATINSTDGTESLAMVFVDCKTFLSRKGVAHWGSEVQIINFEAHDTYTAAMVFGLAGIYNALITGYTNNPINQACFYNSMSATMNCGKTGFQYYDTYSRAALASVTFRNFNGTTGLASIDYAVRYLDQSDEYLNQGINAASGIRFENVPPQNTVVIQECGCDCGDCSYSSMSSRLYTVYDFDGTLSQTKVGTPTLLGSNFAWWNVGADCSKTAGNGLWRCDWLSRRQIVYIDMQVPGLSDGCDASVGTCCRNGNCQQAQYTIGYVNQWGAANSPFSNASSSSKGISLSPWAGATGMANTGWYWRVRTDGALAGSGQINGAPSQFFIENQQIAAETFIVLAVAYPPQTSFLVTIYHWGSLHTQLPMAASLSVVTTPTETLNPWSSYVCAAWPAPWDVRCTNTSGVGPAWYFDGSYFYLRYVNYACYTNGGEDNCYTNGVFNFYNDTIWSVTNEWSWNVTAVCSSGCTVQSSLDNSIVFYSVPDVVVPTPFPSNWGAAPAAVNPVYATSNPPPTPSPAPTTCNLTTLILPANAGIGGCQTGGAVSYTCQPACNPNFVGTLSSAVCQATGLFSPVTGTCTPSATSFSHSASHRSRSHHSISQKKSKTASLSHRSQSHHSHLHTHSKSHHSNSHRSLSHHSRSHHSRSHHSRSHHSRSKSHHSKSHHSRRSRSRSHRSRSKSHRSHSKSHHSKSHHSKSHHSK